MRAQETTSISVIVDAAALVGVALEDGAELAHSEFSPFDGSPMRRVPRTAARPDLSRFFDSHRSFGLDARVRVRRCLELRSIERNRFARSDDFARNIAGELDLLADLSNALAGNIERATHEPPPSSSCKRPSTPRGDGATAKASSPAGRVTRSQAAPITLNAHGSRIPHASH